MKSCFYLKWWVNCLGRNHDLIPYTPYLIFLPIGGAIILRGGRFKSLLDDSWYDRYLIGKTYLAPCSLKLYIFQENFLVYLPLVVKPLILNLVSAIARNSRKFQSAALSKTVISKGGSLSALRGFTANTALFVNQLSLLMKNSCWVWFFICSFRHFFCSRAPGGRGRARSCIPRSSEGFTVRYISVMQEVSSPRSWHFNNSEHF